MSVGQPTPDIDDNDESWLTVPQGQFTFDREGTDPLTLTIHWPGKDSGVTIGRGYDIGQREDRAQVISDLSVAGISTATAKMLADAPDLAGNDARDFVLAHKAYSTRPKHGQQLQGSSSTICLLTAIRLMSKRPEKVWTMPVTGV